MIFCIHATFDNIIICFISTIDNLECVLLYIYDIGQNYFVLAYVIVYLILLYKVYG